MSRPFKFRAWYQGKMYAVQKMQVIQTFANYTEGMDVFTLVSPAGTLQTVAAHQVEIMQFTGMLDKNGKEIFEGDIVRVVGYDRGEVAFGKAGFLARCTDGHLALLENMSSQWLEVIGNLYETPELLKEQA